MAEVVLFHHALGLTPGVVAFADQLRQAGHVVHTPDLFDGRTFDDIESGLAYVRQIGFSEVMARGKRAVERLPAELVYAGFSLGVVPAQMLAQTRPGARGALLFYACVPVSEFGTAWPAGVPVQVHGMDADPYFVGEGDIDAARALIAEAGDGELFLYPGDQHYFADSSQPSYDAEASALLMQRVLDFLDKETTMNQTDTLATLFQHNRWANLRLLEQCAALTSEQLDATLIGAYGSIRDTLQHIATAERSYHARISTGQPYRRPKDAPPMTMAEMQDSLSASGAGLIEWAAKVQPGDTAQVDWDGSPRDVPKTILLTQAINHATEHRAQVMGILTHLGIEPPELDAWMYFDQHGQ